MVILMVFPPMAHAVTKLEWKRYEKERERSELVRSQDTDAVTKDYSALNK